MGTVFICRHIDRKTFKYTTDNQPFLFVGNVHLCSFKQFVKYPFFILSNLIQLFKTFFQ